MGLDSMTHRKREKDEMYGVDKNGKIYMYVMCERRNK